MTTFACGDDDSTPADPEKDTGVDSIAEVDSGSPHDAGSTSDVSRDSGVRFDASADSGSPRADSSVADSGVVDSGASDEDAGSALAASAECLKCEQSNCSGADILYTGMPYDLTTLCDTLEGTATDGPKEGTARSQLCKDVLSCVRRTGCAESGYLACVCGPSSNVADCTTAVDQNGITKLPGACRNEYIAAGETTDWAVLRDLLSSLDAVMTDRPQAVKMADVLLDCGRNFCIEECYGKVCTPTSPANTYCAGEDHDYDPRVCVDGTCPKNEVYPPGAKAGATP